MEWEVESQANCGICGDRASGRKPFFCSTCASTKCLDNRVKLIKVMTEIATFQSKINGLLDDNLQYKPHRSVYELKEHLELGHNWTSLLNNRVHELGSRLKALQLTISITKQTADSTCQSIASLKEGNSRKLREIVNANELLRHSDGKRMKVLRTQLASRHADLREMHRYLEDLQNKRCREVCVLFGIREVSQTDLRRFYTMCNDDKRPPGRQSDSVIGFNVIPDLSILANYSDLVINCSLERVAYFCVIVGYYLNIKLSYTIWLPRKTDWQLRIWRVSEQKRTLWFTGNIHSFARDHKREFKGYAEGLAMLVLCLAEIATHRGIQLRTPESVQIDKVISQICRTFERDSLNPVKEPLTDQPAVVPPTLAAVQEYIINQIDLTANEVSAEWNLVEADSLEDVSNGKSVRDEG
jgi:hypothetical protein